MKRSKWTCILSLLLIACMIAQPVSAAGRGRGGNSRGQSSSSYFDNWKNKTEDTENTSNTDTTESEEVMTVVEDETTVENGDMLRASTYALTTADESGDTTTGDSASDSTESTIVKYFPVTMYDYDADTINAATDRLDSDLTLREGIYFSNGSPDYTAETTTDMSAFVAGQYYIQNIRASENSVASWLYSFAEDTSIRATANQNEATLWNLVIEDGNYYLMSGDRYLVVGTNGNTDGLTTTKTPITISAFSGNVEGVQLSQNGYYLCQWGSETSIYYGGYNVNNDDGNGMRFYRVEKDEKTLTTLTTGETAITSGYEAWNRWDKASGDSNNGQKTYTGLVQSTLDSNKDIVFTKPEGGIFNSDSSVKSIYTNVEMPFVFEGGYYTFDASQNGVYFYEDETQSSDGTAASNTRLYFNEGNTQSNGSAYGDGSSTVWAPYNDSTNLAEAYMNYHFGMRATIPFSMTPNGRIVATDDSTEPIKFSFSGDDDVWVFIDGQLVVDLGGIHNRLNVEIDFAANTVTYSEDNNSDAATGSYNDDTFELEQTLFDGLISQDRTTFAASESHELTIFYLERGEGSSNCKIKFNLPVNDSVTVTKDATQSWNEKTSEVSPLTSKEQEIINNIDFGFTLYQSTDGGAKYNVLANTNYYLLNSNNQIIDTPATDANGHFYLKNGQSAKFITTQMDVESYNVIYYVKEDATDGFTDPDYNYSGEAADGFWYQTSAYTDEATGNTFKEINQKYSSASLIPEYEVYDGTGASGKVTVYGSVESEDSLTFICSNFLNAELPNPSARPVEDKIVIDYGLPVEIDVMANDVYRGDSIELLSVTGAGVEVNAKTGDVTTAGVDPVYGTAVINNGKITYTLNKQLFGVEVLNYVVKVTGTAKQEATEEVKTAYEYAVGTVYIIPATTMYYEENFSDLVTYTGSGWDTVYTVDSAYQNELQEPGVVGTVGDSPYGSDVAYLNDSKDSNGTSRHASTTNGAVKFEYTFTGTGTSFFARTTNNTGYMRVIVKDSSGNTIQSLYRNTIYVTEDSAATLYNIPVFTTDALDYGTYTVTATVAKANTTTGYKSDFWLDGIRVVNPLSSDDANYTVATAAYATDSEQNMANVTLRNKLIREADYDEEGNITWTDGGNFVLFTDVDGTIDTAEEYESIGPKEEVYLNEGQSVTFSLTNWDPNGSKIYLGMKAPFGTGTAAVNGNTVNVNNAADCYYDISSYATITTDENNIKTATFTITAGEGSLISVTNIKVTGDSVFTIIQDEDIEVEGSEGDGTDNE